MKYVYPKFDGICVWHENIYNTSEFPLNANNYIFDSKKSTIIKKN
jgi:hypothetical protein